jgi:hypothetical protein
MPLELDSTEMNMAKCLAGWKSEQRAASSIGG